MDPSLLQERVRRLRIPVRDLAKKAGLDEDNVHRILKGRSDARQSSLRALNDTLSAEERDLKTYLDKLLGSAAPASVSASAADGEAA